MIAIDCDGVIINTIRMFIQLNNELNDRNDNWQDVRQWDFKDVVTNFKGKSEIDEFFNHKKLYKNPIFFENCIEVLNRLNKKYKITIVTAGQNKNIRNKLKMFNKYLPDINVIPVMSPNFTLSNKNMIKCDIMLDDHVRNLDNPNAEYKILFEPYDKMEWNKDWKGKICRNWLDFERMVDEFYGE
jgi:5'(3')-deoxyribonucleotidase